VRLIFLGPPGAGKGTQAAIIGESFGVPHISTGDILRTHVAEETDLGQKAKDYMDQGELVPDQLILDMVEHRLQESDAQNGWILDGFPRNISQADFIAVLVLNADSEAKNSTGELKVINLDVPDQILVERLLARGRKDDNEEIIRHRLQVYREQTAPLIDYYRKRNQLEYINGNRAMDDITQELKQVVSV
jgi:Adenylate kinase and related kinases